MYACGVNPTDRKLYPPESELKSL